MEVDSGCRRTVISKQTADKIWHGEFPKLNPASNLYTWSHQPVHMLGTAEVPVAYKDKTFTLPLLIAESDGPSLIGRNWFSSFGISVDGIHKLHVASCEEIVRRYDNIFAPGIGTFKGDPVTVQINQNANPRFCKPRPVPFALRDRVEKQLDHMVEQGILAPVGHSKWATPVVVSIKKDGSVRLCGDYSVTVNPVVDVEAYPLPTSQECFAAIAGGVKFSKVDLTDAYLQLKLDEPSQSIMTINTCKGLFKVLRLMYGFASASAIFQRFMEQLLKGIDGITVLQDDVLVSGRSNSEHDNRLHEVLKRISDADLRLRKDKCQFGVDSVIFLGYRVDSTGIHPVEDKVDAIRRAPSPTDKTQLQSFLGLLNFYASFIPHRSSVLEPLHRLLDKDQPWKWTQEHQQAFEHAKSLLVSSKVLVHYDSTRPVVLSCDASPYGVGAVLAHVNSNGSEAPIAFASRTLTSAERNYAQIDKEALACMFGVKKFHQYLCGRFFEIITDHKPLLGLFHPYK